MCRPEKRELTCRLQTQVMGRRERVNWEGKEEVFETADPDGDPCQVSPKVGLRILGE